MYTNTFKNELTTYQKGKSLLNSKYFILLSQCRKEYSYKTYANCTGFIIFFDFILNIPVNNFSVISAYSTKIKIKMRGSRERVAEGPDPLPGKSETFGAL